MPDNSNRRDEAKDSREFSDVGQNLYRPDGTGKLKLRKEVLKHPGEKHILRLRQYLTWIEGELEQSNNEQALIYLEQMEPWIYQLKGTITDALGK